MIPRGRTSDYTEQQGHSQERAGPLGGQREHFVG